MKNERDSCPYPKAEGLYHPRYEKDACGVGFITNIQGERSHQIIQNSIQILKNMEHRGAAGADPKVGDGAGILTQIPHELFEVELKKKSIELPIDTDYGVGMIFMPKDNKSIKTCKKIIKQIIESENQKLIGWRKVPVNDKCISESMLKLEPAIYQVFIKNQTSGPLKNESAAFERKLYLIRRLIEKTVMDADIANKKDFYVCSLSSSTIIYKGMFLAYQLEQYYPDLKDKKFKSALGLVHQRFSTNTFPTWGLAQPFRFIAHNGEINTLRGNLNWAHSRESVLASDYFGSDIQKLFPIIDSEGSDSACFDNYFEMLIASGRSMEHSFLMMVPEAWQNQKDMGEKLKGFYQYHSALMEPWDGPAAIMFTDGKKIGGGLDRNGLRPVRYTETFDGLFIMASETGVMDIPLENIKRKGRLGPGKILVVDTEEGEIYFNDEIKEKLSGSKPYARWLDDMALRLDDLPFPAVYSQPDFKQLRQLQNVFLYSREDMEQLIKPMITNGIETTYSMGNDTPLAVLSSHSKLLYNYFKQHFAQVTNPAIDSIREELVMSIIVRVGGSFNILDETPGPCTKLEISSPVLTNSNLEQLRSLELKSLRSQTINTLYAFSKISLEKAVDQLCQEVEKSVDLGHRLIILSDRGISKDLAPIPALLAVSAIHNYLIRKEKRGKASIILESGEVREVHHYATLIGYGASAINPYLVIESITQLETNGELPAGLDSKQAAQNYIKAVCKGLKKIFAKMGISTLASYHGAQIFEAVGLNSKFINKYFTGTQSVIEGIGIKEIEKEIKIRHLKAYAEEQNYLNILKSTGDYHWRSQGEYHAYNPMSISKLQQATRKNSYDLFKEYSAIVNEKSTTLQTIRGMFKFDFESKASIRVSEVTSVEEICKRFVTGAMSIGSISREAHETIAIAMNRLGGKSNSGEGGEDANRFTKEKNGDWRRSAIKQVASGRFGVTSHYLQNADELQIKLAQGAKPGEGGQLPGFKVTEYIGKLRHTIPGVSLISPPPHHDIYSIEDLAQLIFDLKNANPKADINVKLVSESGVGTIAAGVAKCLAEVVTISGYDGGTGAAPATSIKHTGLPWEIGLAEAQQVLVRNNLRGQIRVQVDGQLKTGRDVVIAAILGAEEFGFATSALIVLGCLMMRKCHLNSCPVGVATQDSELRKNFHGKAEYLINFFHFIAREVREIMAKLGIRKFEDLIGQTQLLKTKNSDIHWKTNDLDFSKLFYKQKSTSGHNFNVSKPNHHLEKILDHDLIKKSAKALEKGTNVVFKQNISNRNRTAGTMLGNRITEIHGVNGLLDDTIKINFFGTAGQSFGAFIPSGLTMNLTGEANDYVGKGLSGGKIMVSAPPKARFKSSENMIIGNTALYGATKGEAYFSGRAGERFAVRNSGAITVVEGVGDHGCEYMTGGTVIVLGKTGKNFAAGMSGGIAYIYDKHHVFPGNCNQSMVDIEKISDGDQIDNLKKLIQNHFHLTQSKLAKSILDNWSRVVADFVMVIPFEYRKIMISRFMPN
jgi:glutamate synthase (NADPH) large chain